MPSKTESGRAKYTYSNMSGAKVAGLETCRLDTPERVIMMASPMPIFNANEKKRW